MNRLHIVHHGMGGFRPLRAIFLILIGILMGFGFARSEKGCAPTVWPKNYPLPEYYRQVPSAAPAAPAASPSAVGPR